MDNNTYDLLSYEDVCNLDTEIASKHITMHIQINCSTHAYNHFFNNMDYKSCVSSNYNTERYIVPVEVIQDDMFKEFKTACRANYKIYKHFENIDYCFAKTIIEHCAERELIVEITIENFIKFIEKYLNNEITMDTMEIKCLTYLMCTLAKDIFGIFFNDKLSEMLSLLGKDANKIADALSIMNNL